MPEPRAFVEPMLQETVPRRACFGEKGLTLLAVTFGLSTAMLLNGNRLLASARHPSASMAAAPLTAFAGAAAEALPVLGRLRGGAYERGRAELALPGGRYQRGSSTGKSRLSSGSSSDAARGAVPALSRLRARLVGAAAAENGAASGVSSAGGHILLVVADPNPYLGEGTRAALKRAAATAMTSRGRVTALVLQTTGQKVEAAAGATSSSGNMEQQLNSVRWWFENEGLDKEKCDELVPDLNEKAEAAVADVADELDSVEVVLAAELVKSHMLDMSLLATFVGCPLVVVPE